MEDITIKEVDHIIQTYEDLKKQKVLQLSSNHNSLDGAKATLTHKSNTLEVSIEIEDTNFFIRPQHLFVQDSLLLKKGKEEIVVYNSGSLKETDDLSSGKSTISFTPQSVVVQEKNLSEELRHTAVIAIQETPDLTAFPIQRVRIGSNNHYKYFTSKIGNKQYDCFFHEDKSTGEKYLFIESIDYVLIEAFNESVDTLLHCIALFNGDWYNDSIFIYSQSGEGLKANTYQSLQLNFFSGSKITKCKIHDFVVCDRHFKSNGAKESVKIPCHMSKETVSDVTSKIYNNHKIKRIIQLLLEGAATDNLILRASVYSVALETLTNMIYKTNKAKLKPIKNDVLANKMIERFLSIVTDFQGDIPQDSFDIEVINKKLKQINNPTNDDRLFKPFEIYGISLNKHDKKALRARNKFLHGSTPFKDFEKKSSRRSNLKLLLQKLRLLNCMLLLAYCGYKGHVIDKYGIHLQRSGQSKQAPKIRFI